MLIPLRPLLCSLPLALAACGPSASSNGEQEAPGGGPETLDSSPAVGQPAVGQRAGAARHPGDPQGWVPLDHFQGQAVDVVREEHPDGGLRRIVCYLAGLRTPEALHGPEWLQFKNGSPRARKVWVNGINDGPFVAWFPSGLMKWEGTYALGERDGVYRQYFPNSDLQQEFHYERGVPHGSWREWNVGGHRSKEEHFVHGLREGVRREWGKGFDPEQSPGVGDEGNLVLEENFRAGELHGPWRDFWPTTGNRRTMGDYVAGLRAGVWHRYHESGGQEVESHYVDGELRGVQVLWDEAGQKLSEVEHRSGLPHGSSRTWFPGGQLQAEGRMEQGLRVGLWSYWKADGSPDQTWTGNYENDLKVGD